MSIQEHPATTAGRTRRRNNRGNGADAPARLTYEQFTLRAIENLRDTAKGYKGINPVLSGFNAAFKEYFGPEVDPQAITTQLAAEGKIAVAPTGRGRVAIYKPGEQPQRAQPGPTLAKILGERQQSDTLKKVLGAAEK
jgi:hypothetical protein